MSDLTAESPEAAENAPSATPGVAARHAACSRIFAATLSLSLAFCLTVPSSEIRAKAFKMGIIAKSAKTRATF